jgi:Ni/Fe-hydrogenase subunit HybB-like protein
MKRIVYRELEGTPGVYGLILLLGGFVLAALASFWYMEHYGHIVTGMNNQIVWGLPHVFAIFLIVAASGALNVASIGSVFGKTAYKPMARMSGLLAMALLLGGLAVLVLDLGRPDRLIVAMTSYNFKSIFAWNILLYNGFLVIVGIYVYLHMERNVPIVLLKSVGIFAFVWRLLLTTGTGSIFGWLIAREAYDAAVMAPMFIAMSLSFGLAFFILVSLTVNGLAGRPFGDALLARMAKLLAIFATVVLYFTAVQHMTSLYASEHHAYERFILMDGGIYTLLFWVGHILLGNLVPIFLLFHPTLGSKRPAIILASLMIIVGGIAQLYVIVIGGQSFPLMLFPGYEVQSSLNDGGFGVYSPSLPELFLGLGGVAIALAMTVFGMKILKIVPMSLADAAVDPHHGVSK